MSTPNRSLHADTAGGILTPTRTRRMYPIRQALNQIRGLRSEPKSVLVEVCELHENGKRRQCDATNSYLAERLGMTGKNVSRLLSGLVAGGWLECDVFPHLANRRLLTPTPKTRALYVPELAASLSPLSSLSGDTPLLSEDTPEVGIPHPESGDRVTPEVGIGSPQKWGDLSTTTNDHSTNKVVEGSLRSALAAAEKKIEELVSANTELAASNAQLTSDLEEVTHQRNQLRNSLNAQRPNGATASASHTEGGAGRLMDFAESQFSTETGFRVLAGKMNCAAACVEYYLPDMQIKAEGLPKRDAAGWRNYVHAWLKRERDSGTGLVTKMPTPEAAGSESKVQQARNGVDDARELLRRKREQQNG